MALSCLRQAEARRVGLSTDAVQPNEPPRRSSRSPGPRSCENRPHAAIRVNEGALREGPGAGRASEVGDRVRIAPRHPDGAQPHDPCDALAPRAAGHWPSTASQLSVRPPRANLGEVASTLTAQAGPAASARLRGRSPEPRPREAAPARCVVARDPVRVHPPGVRSRRYAALASTASRLNDRGKYSWLAQLSVRLP